MTDSARLQAIKLLLRIGGVLTASAFFAVFMPSESMASMHKWLGLGEFPKGPVVEYLARSVAALYGFHGVLLFVVSTDPVRLRPIVTFLALFNILFGSLLVVIDAKVGLPLWWTASEGPSIIVVGALLALLNARPINVAAN